MNGSFTLPKAAFSSFHIYKPWELKNGVAVPLDPHDVAMAQAGRSQFAGMSEGSFINAIRNAIQQLPRRT